MGSTAALTPAMAIGVPPKAVASADASNKKHLDAGRRRLEEFQKRKRKGASSKPDTVQVVAATTEADQPKPGNQLQNGGIQPTDVGRFSHRADEQVTAGLTQQQSRTTVSVDVSSRRHHRTSSDSSFLGTESVPLSRRSSEASLGFAETAKFLSDATAFNSERPKEECNERKRHDLRDQEVLSRKEEWSSSMEMRNTKQEWLELPHRQLSSGTTEPTEKRHTEAVNEEDHADCNPSSALSVSDDVEGPLLYRNRFDTADPKTELTISSQEPRAYNDRQQSSKDEFAALEQHIEDVTQEKFSLQRAVEATKQLVESLTQENANLTENYNQQGATINELMSEIARYQAKIQANETAAAVLKAEKAKVEQECIIATERSQTFAGELITLEEKVLQTRSRELKLQKNMESLTEELDACRKQVKSLEKDRSNLKSMIEALQEEKKLLMSRVRDAANKTEQPPRSTVDESTSTEDLAEISEPAGSSAENEAIPALLPSLPSEQLEIIDSMNAIVTELGEEKRSLLEELRQKSSAFEGLKAENADLSRKLEHQTQQLELAVAQNMARANLASSSMPEEEQASRLEYVDEGDEVVDRVLQWIMKLFPGGSSSRRGGSKQL